MLSSHIMLALAWIVYFIIHSLMAYTPVKNRIKGKMGSSFKYYRLIYSLIALGLLIPLLIWQITIPSPLLWPEKGETLMPGVMISALGFIGMIICLKKYIVSPEGFKDLFWEGQKPQLQISGLHRLVRHPLYLSTFIFIAGLVLFFPYVSNLLILILMIVYVLLAIPLEEKKLVDLYGDSYQRYRKEVPAILPRLKKLLSW